MQNDVRIQRSRSIVTGPACLYVTFEFSTVPAPSITVDASYCGHEPEILQDAIDENDVGDGFREGVARANADYGTTYHPSRICYQTDTLRVARWVEHVAYEVVEAEAFELLNGPLHRAVTSASRSTSFQRLARKTGVSKRVLGRLAASSCAEEIDPDIVRSLLGYFGLRHQSTETDVN